jgi:hypothetical protein
MAVVTWLVSALVATSSLAGTELPPLAARLPSGDDAMEYWDVTAWFDSGERVVGRFLVTNQGPGDRTAAAVGHVVLADGRALPFQWGRRRDAWTLGPDGRRLEIGKAVLDLSGTTAVLTVTSKKRGIDLRLEMERAAVSATDDFEVVPPTNARGRIGSTTVTGTGALTHAWMDHDEAEMLDRRDELFARAGDTALYLSILTLTDGSQRQSIVLDRRSTGTSGGGGKIEFSGPSISGDPRYPVPSTWAGKVAPIRLTATLDGEWLRMNPLDILPQPFRFLLSLGGRPQRVWADARVTLGRNPTELRGVTVSTFARPPGR